MKSKRPRTLLFFVTEDWYFVSHRLPLALSAQKAGYRVIVVTKVRRHGEEIVRNGLRLIPFENRRSGINPLNEVSTILRLISLYLREKPDVVHHVAMKPILYGSIAARISRMEGVVNAFAGMGWLFTSRERLPLWARPILRGAIKLALNTGVTVVQNPDDEQFLRELGVSPSKIHRIAGAGVDLQTFRSTPEPAGPPVIVLPARLLWDKGVGEFVEAARLIKKKGLASRWILAGEPDVLNPSAIPVRQIEAWVTEGVIEHGGWCEDMPRLLSMSHIVCLPSYREGLPKSLIEAAAAARPIVTTDVPGCREVVRNGENGFLVPPRDSNALAVALEKLIRNPQLRIQMGSRGRIRAEREFGGDSVIRETLALYDAFNFPYSRSSAEELLTEG